MVINMLFFGYKLCGCIYLYFSEYFCVVEVFFLYLSLVNFSYFVNYSMFYWINENGVKFFEF